jgi:hypothetical protein
MWWIICAASCCTRTLSVRPCNTKTWTHKPLHIIMSYSTKNLIKINSVKWYHTDCGTRLLLRYQTLTMMNIKITVTWNVAPCSVVHMYQYFRWAALYPKDRRSWYLCPKLQNITSHKTIIFKLFSVQGLLLLVYLIMHKSINLWFQNI